MILEEINHFEESKHLAMAVVQPQQGAWTRWENPFRTGPSQMESKQLIFLVKAVYDILPSLVNLELWGIKYIQLLQRLWENCYSQTRSNCISVFPDKLHVETN